MVPRMSEHPDDAATHAAAEDSGPVVIRRLHRLVRHGFRPWLGHDVASGGDRDVELRRSDGVARLRPDGTVVLSGAIAASGTQPRVIAGTDAAGFDAAFPPNTRNRRNIVRRLYEIGLLAP